jgi:maltose alpha-D-glucosyltransferase / alpha-amylase
MTRWYSNAIFYSLDVETFFDSNNDGIGDFQGLTKKLNYISGLGATCLWLLPFYSSPNRDNGYDVEDYYSIDPRLGSMGDFCDFMAKAKQLGIRVVIDLVVNHTSHTHPWFQSARKSKHSPFRNFYVWSDTPIPFPKLMLKGEEDTVWTFDEEAGQYYLHRFYKEQPDLNVGNPVVQEEILKVMRFWLCLGVSGFRVDAAELLVENYGLETTQAELIRFLNKMYVSMMRENPDAVLLAEVNGGPRVIETFLHEEGRVQMIFNFFINQNLFLSLAKEDTTVIGRALKALPKIKNDHEWLNFLRIHDELTLSLLPRKEREYVFRKFGPKKTMQIYDRGIRRRLAPMLRNDRRHIELTYSLLFSLPGVPLLRYGDEIGMGDNLDLSGRNSVRTPMQWSSDINAGFSSADNERLPHPIISEGAFSFRKVNIFDQQLKDKSLLRWMQQLILIRKQAPEIGESRPTVKKNRHKAILIHEYKSDTGGLICVHNFSARRVRLPRNEITRNSSWKRCFGSGTINDSAQFLTLGPYGYLWLRA